MRARTPSVVIAVLFVLCIALAVPAAASEVRIVRLSLVDGDVLIDRGTSAGAEPALVNLPITSGTRLSTEDPDARVEVEFENGSTLRFVGPGELFFRELSLTGDGSKITLAELVYGVVYGNIKLERDDDFRLEFGGENVSLHKSSRFRVEAGNPQSTVAVYKGEVLLHGHSDQVVVTKGETLSLNQNNRGHYDLAHGISPFDTDSWDQSRSDYLASNRNADAYSYSGASYGGAYSYGVSDLAYYGHYSFIPGYGYMWQPYGIGPAWDPFMGGAWSFYPGAGWIFVSSNPWGWQPYRYGSWTFVNGFGWGWRPGPRSHWAPVPNVASTPPRFRPPVPPPTSNGPTTLVGGGSPTRPVPNTHGFGGVNPRISNPHRIDAEADVARQPRGGMQPRGTAPVFATPPAGAAIGARTGVADRSAAPSSSAPNQPMSPRATPAPMRPSIPPGTGDTASRGGGAHQGGSSNAGNQNTGHQPSPSGGASSAGHQPSPSGGSSNAGHQPSFTGGNANSGGGHAPSGGGGFSGGGGHSGSFGGGGNPGGGHAGGAAPAPAPPRGKSQQ